jgi:hypothetical protein
MEFEKVVDQEVITIVQEVSSIPNDLDLWVFYDNTSSFTGPDRIQIQNSLNSWIANDLRPSGWIGQLREFYDNTEAWVAFARTIPVELRTKVLLISFVNEASNHYHSVNNDDVALDFAGQPKGAYRSHYEFFTKVGGVHSFFEKFIGVNYPIATTGQSKPFILHALAAIKGRNYTLDEVNALPRNRYFSNAEWESLKSQLLNNPYSTLLGPDGKPGLEQYGWIIKPDRSNVGSPLTVDCPASNLIISPCQFALDMNTILASLKTNIDVEVTSTKPVPVVVPTQGVSFTPQIVNNGYTMSYSLKKEEWVSWHPYIPSFYMHVQEKFYSWNQGSRYLFKHNRPNHYQTFYNVRYPFIVEYVDNPSAMTTKVWDSLLFQTEAKKYDSASEEYLDQRYVTFNKILLYNTQQISGVLNLVPKQDSSNNYLLQQTTNNLTQATIDRNERDWTMNNLRDMRTNYTVPMFLKNASALQTNYYIDKIVNPTAIDFNKDWTDLESFRDKFLVVRLIFDNFADTRLIFNFSALQRTESER